MMVQTWEDVAVMKETVQGDSEKNREILEQYKESMEQYRKKLNSVRNMLPSLPHFRLSSDFPPRQNPDPILPPQCSIPSTWGDLEAKEFPRQNFNLILPPQGSISRTRGDLEAKDFSTG